MSLIRLYVLPSLPVAVPASVAWAAKPRKLVIPLGSTSIPSNPSEVGPGRKLWISGGITSPPGIGTGSMLPGGPNPLFALSDCVTWADTGTRRFLKFTEAALLLVPVPTTMICAAALAAKPIVAAAVKTKRQNLMHIRFIYLTFLRGAIRKRLRFGS